MSTTAASNSREPSSRLWILGPGRDLALFVLVPLWIVPIMLWAKTRIDLNIYGAMFLAFVGVGHHLPGFIRVYTDSALFQRYRTRFIAAPLFLLVVFIVLSLLHLNTLAVIVVLWGAWHGAMQVNGFLRIYDTKVGSFSPLTARLDWAMCLVWFGGGLLHSNFRMTSILLNFYNAGLPVLDPGAFAAFRLVWDVLTACVTLGFLVNAWRETRAGHAPSPVKFLLMASSFGFFWFAMVKVSEPIFGLLIFEIFHDLQYNALVWAYNRRRVDRGVGVGRLETFLFGPGAWRILLYTLLVLAYGTMGVFTGYSKVMAPDFAEPAWSTAGFWTGLFAVSAFLHFYFDGFIWQVREKELRQGLGIEGKKEAKGGKTLQASRPSRLLPAGWKWAFFIVPVALLGTLELHGNIPPAVDQYRNIVTILPESGRLHYLVANLEKFRSHFGDAIEEYSHSLALDPDYQPAHAELADVAAYLGLYEMALSHYLRAAELDSLDFKTREHLATTLMRFNRVEEALPQMLAIAPRFPQDTNFIYLTGVALMHENRSEEAIAYLQSTLALDPRQPQAWSFLGVALRMRGDSARAEEYYRRAYMLDPKNAWR